MRDYFASLLNALRRQIRSNDHIDLWPIQWVDVFIHVIGHEAPQWKCCLRQFQIQAILFTITDECAELARLHVIVHRQQESLVEFEGVVALLHQLKCAVQELCEYGRHFLRVGLYVTTTIAELVSKAQPILFDETLETFYGSVEWIAHQCGQWAHLRRTVPTIGTVHHNRHTFVDSRCDEAEGEWRQKVNKKRFCWDFLCLAYSDVSKTALTCFSQPDDSNELRNPLMVRVFWSMETAANYYQNIQIRPMTLHYIHPGSLTLDQFLQARPHHMDILNAQKLKLNILVECFVFIALAGSTIGHRIYSWPCVDHIHVIRVRIGVAYGLKHLLVFQAAGAESGQRLTAATYRRLVGMQIGEHGQACLWTKFRAAHKHSGGCLCWYKDLAWVCESKTEKKVRSANIINKQTINVRILHVSQSS